MFARAAVVLAVATITFLLLWHFALGNYIRNGPTKSAEVTATTSATSLPGQRLSPSPQTGTIPIPLSTNQQKAAALAAGRAPYFHWLVNQGGGDVADAETDRTKPATLIVHLTVASQQQAADVISRLIVPYAGKYGFDHARIYLPQDAPTEGAYRLAYELDHPKGEGWIIFGK